MTPRDFARGVPRPEEILLDVRRRFELPGLAHRRYRALSVPGLRVYLLDTDRVVFDTRMQPAPAHLLPPSRKAQAVVVLDGEYVHRHGARERTLRAGDALVARLEGWDERWDGGRFRLLIVEWGERFGGDVPELDANRLDALDLRRFRAIADRLDPREPGHPGDAPVREAIEAARVLGAPVTPWGEVPLSVLPAPVLRVQNALSEVLSRPHLSPTWVDLERLLGVGERSARRWLHRHAGHFGPLTDLRSYLRHWKLSSACLLLTARGSRLEDVAKATGYGSARALLRAFNDVGIPAPSEIRRALGLRVAP